MIPKERTSRTVSHPASITPKRRISVPIETLFSVKEAGVAPPPRFMVSKFRFPPIRRLLNAPSSPPTTPWRDNGGRALRSVPG